MVWEWLLFTILQVLLIRALAPSGSEPQSSTVLLLMVQKSCTSWYGKCPIIYRVSHMLICWVVSRISSINSMLSCLVGSLGLKLMTRSYHTKYYMWCVCLAVFFWERTESRGSGGIQYWFSKHDIHVDVEVSETALLLRQSYLWRFTGGEGFHSWLIATTSKH